METDMPGGLWRRGQKCDREAHRVFDCAEKMQLDEYECLNPS